MCGFSRIRGTVLEVPMGRTIVFWGLYWRHVVYGNYHVAPVSILCAMFFSIGFSTILSLRRSLFVYSSYKPLEGALFSTCKYDPPKS